MKRILSFISVILLGMVSLLLFFHTACTIKSTPVTATTANFAQTPTPTITPTPNNCPSVTLPAPGGSALVLYSNGTTTPDNASPVAFDTFSGGGGSNPTVSVSSFDPLSNHTAEVSVGFNYVSGWTGLSLAPTTGTVDLSAFSTCTFWTRANEAVSEGFDAAQPSSGCTALVYENVTTCWQEFTIHLVSGNREDSCTGALTACIDYFVCSQAQSPGAGITAYTIYFDQVQLQ